MFAGVLITSDASPTNGSGLFSTSTAVLAGEHFLDEAAGTPAQLSCAALNAGGLGMLSLGSIRKPLPNDKQRSTARCCR